MSQSLVQALCSKCNKLSNLETCFECNAALCRRCVIEHFERWKDGRIPECDRIERDLEGCKRRIGIFAHLSFVQSHVLPLSLLI